AEEREDQRAGQRQRNGARQDDERIPEALELRRQNEVDQDAREEEGPEELAPLLLRLPRLAGIVDEETLRKDRPGLLLEVVESRHERHARRDDALDVHRAQLLEPPELPRLGR